MGFSIVQGSPQKIWVPVEPGEALYTGAIVAVDTATPLEGVRPMPVAAGASNATNKDVPFGIVCGNNSTSETTPENLITQVAAGAVYESTTSYRGLEGPFINGDPQAYVEIELIDPSCVIRGPIFDTTEGTIVTPVTVTVGSGTDGIGCTTGAATVATVADFSTIHPRSGKNKGVYRTLTSASTTAHTWLKAMYGDMEVGDTAIVLNGLRPYGLCKMQIDSEALFVDANAALTSHNFHVIVTRLELSEPGNEFVEFRFDGDNFCSTAVA